MADTREPPTARGADRVSDLPEGVLHHILSLLPAQDAVRTGVLAQSWRNRWRAAPAVRFVCSIDLPGGVGTFGRFLDGLLRVRRRGPPLDSCYFDLHVDRESCYFDLDLRGNDWIRRVLELNVRELRFRVYCDSKYPFTLDSRPLSSQHLTSLELTGVAIDDTDVLDFSGCSALVNLMMEECLVSSMEMHSPSLKHLSITNCIFYFQMPHCHVVPQPHLIRVHWKFWKGSNA